MGDESTRTDVSQMSRMSDISESDIARLEELREIGKKAKTEARDMDLESLGGCSTVSKNERKRQLAIAKTHKLVLTKKKREILKEEDYLSDMDKIITESFFPHYNNLKGLYHTRTTLRLKLIQNFRPARVLGRRNFKRSRKNARNFNEI